MYKKMLQKLNSDKILHFLYGAVLTLPFLLLSLFFQIHVILLSLLVSLVIGASKELLDLLDNTFNKKMNSVELMDIVATVVGGLYVGIIVTLLK
jgi:hypothetical protein